MQPDLRQLPVAPHGFRRHLQRLRAFPPRSVRRRTASRRPGLLRASTVANAVSASSRATRSSPRSCDTTSASSNDTCVAPPPRFRQPFDERDIHEDAAHQARRHGEEVRAVLPAHAVQVHQPQVRLVDEGRGLQRVACAFLAHVPLRQAVQLLPHERDQLVEGVLLACPPGLQQLGHAVADGGSRRLPKLGISDGASILRPISRRDSVQVTVFVGFFVA